MLKGDVSLLTSQLLKMLLDAAVSDYLHQLFISRALITDHTADALGEGSDLNVASGGDQSSSCSLPSEAVSPHLSKLARGTQ